MRAPRSSSPILAAALLLAGAAPARGDIDLKFGGLISSDIRYRLFGEPVSSPYPSQYQLLKFGFSRNENTIKTKLTINVGSRAKAVADVDFVAYGFSDLKDIDAATLRERVDPYRFEANAAYIDIYQLLPGLDLRLGRQTVVWGAADQFNPTSNVNTLDLSDALLFGRQLANNMIRLDWNPKGDWIITGVVVPIFRPAQLPRSAPFALRQLDRPAPVQEDEVRRQLGDLALLNPPTEINVFGLQPQPSIDNVQAALRVAGRILNQDVSLSYYHGRFGIPTPAVTVNRLGGSTDVGVVWPRMDVVGADIAGTIDKLGGLGYWIEGAVTFPGQVDFQLYIDSGNSRTERRLAHDGSPADNVDVDKNGKYAGVFKHKRATVISNAPFFKLTIGADMSFGQHVYVNLQYLHGFIDEFGAGKDARGRQDVNDPKKADDPRYGPLLTQRIGDYLVGGLDLKFFSDALLLRVFGVIKLPSLDPTSWKLDPYRPTGVLFPQLTWTVWDGTDLMLGAFIFLGDRSTKFGDPAAGASEVFLKGRFQF